MENERTLHEVCDAVGVTRRAVQGYEKYGLVAASGKNKMGHLLYHRDTIAKIEEIRQFQKRGFTLKEIAELETVNSEQKKDMLQQKLTILKQNYSRMERTIAVIQQMIKEL